MIAFWAVVLWQLHSASLIQLRRYSEHYSPGWRHQERAAAVGRIVECDRSGGIRRYTGLRQGLVAQRAPPIGIATTFAAMRYSWNLPPRANAGGNAVVAMGAASGVLGTDATGETGVDEHRVRPPGASKRLHSRCWGEAGLAHSAMAMVRCVHLKRRDRLREGAYFGGYTVALSDY